MQRFPRDVFGGDVLADDEHAAALEIDRAETIGPPGILALAVTQGYYGTVTRCSLVQSDGGTSVACRCSLLRLTMSSNSVSTPISRR